MNLTISELLRKISETVAETAPDGLKKNGILRHLGQLSRQMGSYGDGCVQLDKPEMSNEGLVALARAEREEQSWARKDCGCK